MLVPLSTQGSGKTYFFDNVVRPFFALQRSVRLKLLSSDEVNLELVQRYQDENPGIDKTEAFQKTRFLYKDAYEKHIQKVFSEIYSEALAWKTPKDRVFFLYIDKNHPLNYPSQNLVHDKLKRISENNDLHFVSLSLLAREVCPLSGGVRKFEDRVQP